MFESNVIHVIQFSKLEENRIVTYLYFITKDGHQYFHYESRKENVNIDILGIPDQFSQFR